MSPLWGLPSEPEPEDRVLVYACPVCRYALELVDVFRVDMHGLDLIKVTHWCDLDGRWHVTRYPHRRSALNNLFGEPVTLPWCAVGAQPHADGEVVEVHDEGDLAWEDMTREQRIESQVLRWTWELEGVDHAGDLLNRMRGPRSQDAAIAEEFRRRHRSTPEE